MVLHCGSDLWPKMKVTSVNDQLHLVSDRLATSPPSVADQSTTRPWHLQNLSEILLRILRLLCIWLWRRCRAVAMYVWQAVTTKFYMLVANPGEAQPSPTCVFCLGNLLRIEIHFIAHLSRRLMWAIATACRSSSVCLSSGGSHLRNFFRQDGHRDKLNAQKILLCSEVLNLHIFYAVYMFIS